MSALEEIHQARIIGELHDATPYAESLAVNLHRKHYSEVEQWEPLSGDVIGLLTQIDNMTAGLVRCTQDQDTSHTERAAQ